MPDPPQWQTTVEIKQITTDELPERPTMRQVAAWLGMTYGTVRLMAIDGSLPCKKIKRRANNVYLFDKAALLEWAKPERAIN